LFKKYLFVCVWKCINFFFFDLYRLHWLSAIYLVFIFGKKDHEKMMKLLLLFLSPLSLCFSINICLWWYWWIKAKICSYIWVVCFSMGKRRLGNFNWRKWRWFYKCIFAWNKNGIKYPWSSRFCSAR
jgi:hypothetical protein